MVVYSYDFILRYICQILYRACLTSRCRPLQDHCIVTYSHYTRKLFKQLFERFGGYEVFYVEFVILESALRKDELFHDYVFV